MHAVDYLLKPFSKERFNEALLRVMGNLQSKTASKVNSKLNKLLDTMQQPKLNRLTIREQGRMYFVNVEEIEWIEAAGNYAEIHTSDKTHLIRETMTKLEKQLCEEQFVRVNRSAIVKVAAIQEVISEGKNDHYVVLQSGAKVKMTMALKELQGRLDLL